MLNEEQMAALAAMLEEADAANPEPMEEEPEMEEAQNIDEVDADNEAVDELSEGDGEMGEEEVQPDPDAGEEAPAAPAPPALPEGIESVEQLVQEYSRLIEQENQRGEELKTLREMNDQLVAIAQVLGYSKDIESVDLSAKDDDPNSQMRAMISEQFKPLIEQQQKNLRSKMIDASWKQFGADHSDVKDFMEGIKKVLGESPELYDSEDGLAVAYHMARSNAYKNEDTLFDDDAFIEKAAKNDKVKEKVIAEHLKKVKKSGADAPASVGKGGSAAATKQKHYGSMEEAHKAARKMFGL